MNTPSAINQSQTALELDTRSIRSDFPVLNQQIHRQRDLIYLDNGASTQHPVSVIEAMNDQYRKTYANVHRGIHWLSEQSTGQFENARRLVQTFINARHNNEVIFTSGTTASVNLVARSWGDANVGSGDQVLVTQFEHHSNIVPWQQLAQRTGAMVRFVGITEEGELDWDDFNSKLNNKTKLVAVAAVSNLLGTRVPIAKVSQLAHAAGALVLVDAAQHAPHEPTDVQAWDADFVAFSGHKMLGPSGIGVLWGRQSILESMPPCLGGGGMIQRVTEEGFTAGELPAKFEAGTPPIVEATGLGAAIEYLNQFDLNTIFQHEQKLATAAIEQISQIKNLRILGPPAERRAGIVGFVVDGLSPQDIAVMLDRTGIAIRAGHHCAMPLHDRLGIRSSCRASFYLYNTMAEAETFARELENAVTRLA